MGKALAESRNVAMIIAGGVGARVGAGGGVYQGRVNANFPGWRFEWLS